MLSPLVVDTVAAHTSSIRAAATALEAQFISEMLKAAGFAESRGALGGGIGEEQFSSMLNDAYAHGIAERGGFGLSESIVKSLLEKSHEKS